MNDNELCVYINVKGLRSIPAIIPISPNAKITKEKLYNFDVTQVNYHNSRLSSTELALDHKNYVIEVDNHTDFSYEDFVNYFNNELKILSDVFTSPDESIKDSIINFDHYFKLIKNVNTSSGTGALRDILDSDHLGWYCLEIDCFNSILVDASDKYRRALATSHVYSIYDALDDEGNSIIFYIKHLTKKSLERVFIQYFDINEHARNFRVAKENFEKDYVDKFHP